MDDHDLIKKNLQPFPEEEEEQVRWLICIFSEQLTSIRAVLWGGWVLHATTFSL